MEIDLWSLPEHDYLLGDWPNLTVERLKVYLGFGGDYGDRRVDALATRR